VQRRATKLITSLKEKTYEETYIHWKLGGSGEILLRFLRFKGSENLDPCMFFRLNTAPTGGHSLKLIKPRCHLDVRKNILLHTE